MEQAPQLWYSAKMDFQRTQLLAARELVMLDAAELFTAMARTRNAIERGMAALADFEIKMTSALELAALDEIERFEKLIELQ